MSTPSFSLQALMRQARHPDAPVLLLLHGYGSNEEDLFGLAPYLGAELTIVSARAPVMLMPGSYAWFEIGFTAQGIEVDLRGAQVSLGVLADFVQEVAAHTATEPARMCIAGFSQGATMAAALALTRPDLVGSAMVLSGIVPSEILAGAPQADIRRLPFLVAHGLYDQVVPIAHGRASKALLEQLHAPLTYHEYPMGHEISMACLRDMHAWLRERGMA